MPAFLEDKLKKEYGAKSKTVFAIMNSLGVMHGNKETAKGVAMEAKHDADMKADPTRHLLGRRGRKGGVPTYVARGAGQKYGKVS